MANVKIVVLDNGEHLLGDIIEHDDGSLTIENPVSIVPNPENQGTLLFIPATQFYTDDNLLIKERYIRYVKDAQNDIEKNWIQRFGSGLIMPDKNGLMLG